MARRRRKKGSIKIESGKKIISARHGVTSEVALIWEVKWCRIVCEKRGKCNFKIHFCSVTVCLVHTVILYLT